MNKIILTDVDGVLLDYEQGFRQWMKECHGYSFNPAAAHDYRMSERYGIDDSKVLQLIQQFNESPHELQPLRDAQSSVRYLHDTLGYKFIAITSFGTEEKSVQHRGALLERHFGSVFDDIICLPLASGKQDTLTRWANSGLHWIEDYPKNAQVGKYCGLCSILMQHDYNQTFDHTKDEIHLASDWQDVVDIIKECK